MLLFGKSLNYAAKFALVLAFRLSPTPDAAFSHLEPKQFACYDKVVSAAGRRAHVSDTIALVSFWPFPPIFLIQLLLRSFASGRRS